MPEEKAGDPAPDRTMFVGPKPPGPDAAPGPDRQVIDVREVPHEPAEADGPGDTFAEKADARADLRLHFLEPCPEPGSLGRLGHYRVLEVLGRGACGVVLKAFDEKLQRLAAIKVMVPQLADNETARRRFVREARAAAAVRDPHVVQVFDVEESPLPYLVMEYVRGGSLQDRIDKGGALAVPDVVRIGAQVAQGLAAAHRRGQIHRDIKPANILLQRSEARGQESGIRSEKSEVRSQASEIQGQGSGRGEPAGASSDPCLPTSALRPLTSDLCPLTSDLCTKITDFGLARAADDVSLTQSGVIVGTPLYMSPEQARGEALDARSDLFSLGSVLYTLCTGQPPFKADKTIAVLRRVCEDSPRPISDLNPAVPAWLAALVRKLLAKDPAERYQTAAEVADQLRQHLAHLEDSSLPAPDPFGETAAYLPALKAPGGPAEARPAARPARARRLAPTVVAAVLVAAAVPYLLHHHAPVRLKGDQQRLEASSPLGKTNEATHAAAPVQTPPEKRHGGQADEKPADGPAGAKKRWPEPTEARELAALTAAIEGSPNKAAAFEARATWYACRGRWKESARDYLARVDLRPRESQWWLPAAACLVLAGDPDGYRKLCDRMLQQYRDTRVPLEANIVTKIFLLVPGADASRLAAAGIHQPADEASGPRFLPPWTFAGLAQAAYRAGDFAQAIRWSDKSLEYRRGVPGSREGNNACPALALLIRAMAEHRLHRPDEARRSFAEAATLIPGELRMLGTADQTVNLPVNASTVYHDWLIAEVLRRETEQLLFPGLPASVEGKPRPGRADEQPALTWVKRTPPTPEELAARPSPADALKREDIPPALLARVGGGDKNQAPAEVVAVLQGHQGQVRSVAISPDGKILASAGDDRTVRLWDLATGQLRHTLGGFTRPVYTVAFSPDGKLLASGTARQGEIKLWDPVTGAERGTLRGQGMGIAQLAFSPDGRLLAFRVSGGPVKLWEVPAGRPFVVLEGGHPWEGCVAFSHDGKVLASGGSDKVVHLLDVSTRTEFAALRGHQDIIRWAGFHPDGQSLAACGQQQDSAIRIWDLATLKEREVLRGHDGGVLACAWRADGKLLASVGTTDGTVRLWDLSCTPARSRTIRLFPPDTHVLHGVALTPEGRYVATANPGGTVYVLRLARRGEVLGLTSAK